MSFEISVIVPHLNQPLSLAKALRSLLDQDFDMGRIEVVVVDNGSAELPEAVVAGFPGVRLVTERTPGPGPARNLGVSLTSAPILAFTDADCVVAPDWAAVIAARFAADPALEIIGGDVRVTAATPGQPTPAEAYDLLFAFPQRRYIKHKRFSGAGNMAVRRAVFEAVGPFAGIEVAEDTDWGQRAAAAGHRTVYAPEMVVYHPARQHMAELYRKWDRNVSHHYAAFAGGPAGKVRWVAKMAALAVWPVVEIPRIVTSRRIAGRRARWLAFRSLVSLHAYRVVLMGAILIRAAPRVASAQWNRS
jgi:glycosyltransferase involved in cell wall biosynthesis